MTITEPLVEQSTKSKFLYLLYYRPANHPFPLFTFFGSDLPFDKAILRAKEHCSAMGYVFVMVRPAVTNLEAEERKRNGNT